MPGSNERGKYYQQAFMENGQATPPISGGFSDATIVATSNTSMTESNSSPSRSHSGGQLTPTGSVSKPIRRRSRVSKKTPITLLNANAKNFRALVQQFTGCAASTTPSSFGNQKDPINLSFGANNDVITNSVMVPFANHSYNYQRQQQQQWLAQPQQLVQQQRIPLLQLQENQQFHQEQQRMYPTDNVSGSHDVLQYSSSSDYNPTPSMEVVDGFVMDEDDIALHEFSRDLFSN